VVVPNRFGPLGELQHHPTGWVHGIGSAEHCLIDGGAFGPGRVAQAG
jgi:hypothetical protein